MPFYVFFAAVALPAVFVMITWAIVTAYRLYAPEEPQPYEKDEPAWREALSACGEPVSVGARDIRADVRYRDRHHDGRAYRYAEKRSSGLPFVWVEDLSLRRN